MITKTKVWQKWSIAIKIAPILLLVMIIKLLFHQWGYEFLALNALFTSVVAGTIFLIGFLIAGILSDYKESEKLPSELSAALESLYDVTYKMHKGKNSKAAKDFILYQKGFVESFNDWFYKTERSNAILDRISGMNDHLIALEKEGVQANFIIKLENEQNAIRKIFLRIHTIRDTDFIASAYAIVEALAIAITMGMIFMKIEPFYESLSVTLLITFLISYMFFLIKDLDNPFDYYTHGETGTEVSLKPFQDFRRRISGFDG